MIKVVVPEKCKSVAHLWKVMCVKIIKCMWFILRFLNLRNQTQSCVFSMKRLSLLKKEVVLWNFLWSNSVVTRDPYPSSHFFCFFILNLKSSPLACCSVVLFCPWPLAGHSLQLRCGYISIYIWICMSRNMLSREERKTCMQFHTNLDLVSNR
jgi:hypothetical protein